MNRIPPSVSFKKEFEEAVITPEGLTNPQLSSISLDSRIFIRSV